MEEKVKIDIYELKALMNDEALKEEEGVKFSKCEGDDGVIYVWELWTREIVEIEEPKSNSDHDILSKINFVDMRGYISYRISTCLLNNKSRWLVSEKEYQERKLKRIFALIDKVYAEGDGND